MLRPGETPEEGTLIAPSAGNILTARLRQLESERKLSDTQESGTFTVWVSPEELAENEEATPLLWWERPVERRCAALGNDHTHKRLPVRMHRDLFGYRQSFWPPTVAARREAKEAGYPFTLFDRETGWAISFEEADHLEKQWEEGAKT